MSDMTQVTPQPPAAPMPTVAPAPMPDGAPPLRLMGGIP